MGGKLKAGAIAALGAGAFAAGWTKGHVSGIRQALGGVEMLRHFAECRADEGGVSQWVYPPGHPRAGEPFGERPDGEELHFFERYARRYRPFAGVPLLETVEFDAARPLPSGGGPPGEPPWWEEEADDPREEEYREHLRREDERVARHGWALVRLRKGRLGALRMEVRARLGPAVGGDHTIRLEVEARNAGPRALEPRELRLTYLYEKAATELLLGRVAPTTPLAESKEDDPWGTLASGETRRWSVEVPQAKRMLAEHDMRMWPVFALPRPGGVLYRVLPRTGMAGRIGMERLRELRRWYLAAELVDARGARRKAGFEFEAPLEG